jgi:Abortive infection alpha
MDEDSKEFLEIVVGAALKPFTRVVDNAISVLGGAKLEDLRLRKEARLAERRAEACEGAAQLLHDRKVEKPSEVNEEAVEELLDAAENEPREELKAIWAKLLAAMFDPSRAPGFRREFVEIAKQLEPVDVAALLYFNEGSTNVPQDLDHFARKLGVNPEELMLAFRNLARLELTTTRGPEERVTPLILPLGRRFLAAVR